MPNTPIAPSADEDRAAIRAYLGRCEVRLSTLHRIAVSMLSGAGILVLLPILERDSVETVARALLAGRTTLAHVVLAAAVALTILLVVGVVWLLLTELTRLYFHANHIEHPDGSTVFTPRFTLTGLRLPTDELGPAGTEALAAARGTDRNIALLVPPNDRSRERIDRQVRAYPGLLDGGPVTDATRSDALLQLAMASGRPLVDEVAKIELGLARHVLRIQQIVLRYVKALLIVLTTALATFVMAAAVSADGTISTGSERWISVTLALWGSAVLFAATSPVRQLDRLLRAEGAATTVVRDDPELTQLEDVAARVGAVVWLAATAVAISLLATPASTGLAGAAFPAAIATAVALEAVALHRWAGWGVGRRLVGRHPVGA